MINQFVPYNLALRLKELGFNDECLAYYYKHGNSKKESFHLYPMDDEFDIDDYPTYKNNLKTETLAPLWQQAFDWFRDEHQIFSFIDSYPTTENPNRCWYMLRGDNINELEEVDGNSYMSGWFENFEEAKLKCLEQLIKIIENGNKTN